MLPAVQAVAAEAICLEKKINDAVYDIQSNTQYLSPREATYRAKLEVSEAHLRKANQYLVLLKQEIRKAEEVIRAATTVDID